MRFEENLGFEITRELLEKHNTELKQAEKIFFKEWDKIWEQANSKGIKLFDLERALYDYLDIIKEEYYKAGTVVNEIVETKVTEREILNAIEEATA